MYGKWRMEVHINILRLEEYDDIDYHEVPQVQLTSEEDGMQRSTGLGHSRKANSNFVFDFIFCQFRLDLTSDFG